MEHILLPGAVVTAEAEVIKASDKPADTTEEKES